MPRGVTYLDRGQSVNEDKVIDIARYRARRQRRLQELEGILHELVGMSYVVEKAAVSVAHTGPVGRRSAGEDEGLRARGDPAVTSLLELRDRMFEAIAELSRQCDVADGGSGAREPGEWCQGGLRE